jgi:hypothetical protein
MKTNSALAKKCQVCITTSLLLLFANSAVCDADSTHYTWRNERGQPVYSDRPPPKGVDYEVISSSSTFKRVVSGEEGAVPLETDPSPSNQFDQVKKTESNTRKNPELCQRAKNNLEALTSSDQVKVRNNQGEVRMLSPAEMEIERQTARAQESVYCN